MSRRFSYYGSLASCPAISAEAEAVVANIESNSGEVLDCDERQRVEAIVTGEGGFSSVDGSHSHIDMLFHPLKTIAKSLAYWTGTGSATAVNSPTFSSGIGFDLDGVNQYIDSGCDLSTLTNYSLNDAMVSTYITTNDVGSGGNQWSFAVADATGTVQLRQQPTANRWIYNINGGTNFPNADGNTFKALSTYTLFRSSTASDGVFKNGVLLTSSTTARTSIPSGFTLHFGATNFSGTISNFYDGILSGGMIGATVGFSHSTWNTLMQANIGTL